jgi:hypothetical protein
MKRHLKRMKRHLELLKRHLERSERSPESGTVPESGDPSRCSG